MAKEKKDKQSLGRIISNNFLMLRYIGKYVPGMVIWLVGMKILSGVAGVVDTVYLAKYVLDGAQNGKPFVEMVPFFLGVLVLNILVALISGYYDGSYREETSARLYAGMHKELFAKAKNMELSCYDNPEFYNDFVWAMSESDQKALAVLDSVGVFVESVITVGGTAAIVVSVDSIGVWVAAIVLIVTGFVRKKGVKLEYEENEIRRPLQRKRDYTSQVLYQAEYAKEVRLTPVKDKLIDDFSKNNGKLIAVIKKYGWKSFALGVFNWAIIDKVLVYGLYVAYLLYGILTLKIYTLSDFYTLFNGTNRLEENWEGVIYALSDFQKHSLYIERFRQFMEYEIKMKDPENPVEMPKEAATLELRNVTFAYDSVEEPTLKGINLTIHPGEKIAFVGYNGAGKTTLIKLIMRLYEVSGGGIFLGGTNIKDFKLKDFREYFGVVFQDYQLLATTIGENVMMDLVKESDEPAIKNALEKSGFAEKLQTLEHGTKTGLSREFDKEGVNLSGGESQKVAIARVFPRDCKIVILDEPSSALDPISEYNVNQSMLEAAKDKTVIFISHRLSTTRLADRILMLENGRIIEEGSHDALLEQNGKYAEMFNMQAEKYKENAKSHY